MNTFRTSKSILKTKKTRKSLRPKTAIQKRLLRRTQSSINKNNSEIKSLTYNYNVNH